MVLLFGEEPAARPVELEYRDVAERLKSRLSNEGIGVDALSEAVGWELQGVLEDPATLATFNIVGVYDVCCAVGVDWLGLVEHEQMVSHSRSHRAFRRDAQRDWSRTVSKVGGSCSRNFVFTRIVLNV
jgi:hypothetical protein